MPRNYSSAQPRRNFHVPLAEDLYHALQVEAEQAHLPANAVAREAIAHWLELRRQERLDQAVLAYAEAVAGTVEDLDPVLEAAALECLEHEV
jgi:predicted transcriptional regulator